MRLTKNNILKELKLLFRLDRYKELMPILGVKWDRTIWRWKREGVPDNVFPLLTIIYNQQIEINNLKNGNKR